MVTVPAQPALRAKASASIVLVDGEKRGIGKLNGSEVSVARKRVVCIRADLLCLRYWGMQDVIDEALQRLYWACREGRGFPGVVPDETNGRVSTDAILRGLGLSPPPVERRPLVGAEGDSIWGSQEELLIRRSYRPPDIHADGLSSVIAGSSRPTPMSMVGDDQVTVGSSHDPTGRGKAGEETRTEGGQESLHMNLGQQSFPAIDSPADPSLLQDGVVGFMDFDPALYQDLHVTEFHGGNQLAGQTQGMSARVVRSQILAQGPQQELLESSEQVEWEVQQEGTVEDMLPWPGNIAALQKGKELEDDRDGIHHHGRKG